MCGIFTYVYISLKNNGQLVGMATIPYREPIIMAGQPTPPTNVPQK